MFPLLFVLALAGSAESQAPVLRTPDARQYRFAWELYRDGEYGLAAEALRDFLRKYPQSPWVPKAAFLLGECPFREGKYKEALRAFREFLRKYPEDALADDAAYRTGQALFRMERYREAVEVFRKFEREYPKSPLLPDVRYLLGEALYRLGKYEEALRAYGRASSDTGEAGTYALYAMGWIYKKQGRYDMAARAFREVVKRVPDSDLGRSCRLKWGEALLQGGKPEEALEVLKEAIAVLRGEERAYARYLSGEAYFRLGQYSRARSAYRKVLEESPKLAPKAQMGIAWSYFGEKDYRKAIEAFRKVAERFPTSPESQEALFRIGVCWRRLGELKRALEAFREVWKEFPEGEFAEDGLYGAAEVAYALGKYAEALGYSACFGNGTPRGSGRRQLRSFEVRAIWPWKGGTMRRRPTGRSWRGFRGIPRRRRPGSSSDGVYIGRESTERRLRPCGISWSATQTIPPGRMPSF